MVFYFRGNVWVSSINRMNLPNTKYAVKKVLFYLLTKNAFQNQYKVYTYASLELLKPYARIAWNLMNSPCIISSWSWNRKVITAIVRDSVIWLAKSVTEWTISASITRLGVAIHTPTLSEKTKLQHSVVLTAGWGHIPIVDTLKNCTSTDNCTNNEVKTLFFLNYQ